MRKSHDPAHRQRVVSKARAHKTWIYYFCPRTFWGDSTHGCRPIKFPYKRESDFKKLKYCPVCQHQMFVDCKREFSINYEEDNSTKN